MGKVLEAPKVFIDYYPGSLPTLNLSQEQVRVSQASASGSNEEMIGTSGIARPLL